MQVHTQRLSSEPTGQGLDELDQKQFLGARLYPLIMAQHLLVQQQNNHSWVFKVTGMMLEMDNEELHCMLEDANVLREKIAEAMMVLSNHCLAQWHHNCTFPNAAAEGNAAGGSPQDLPHFKHFCYK